MSRHSELMNYEVTCGTCGLHLTTVQAHRDHIERWNAEPNNESCTTCAHKGDSQ